MFTIKKETDKKTDRPKNDQSTPNKTSPTAEKLKVITFAKEVILSPVSVRVSVREHGLRETFSSDFHETS